MPFFASFASLCVLCVLCVHKKALQSEREFRTSSWFLPRQRWLRQGASHGTGRSDRLAHSRPAHGVHRALLILGALLLAACAQTRHHRADGVVEQAALGRGANVLLVEPDIELTELLGSGVQQPRADWTQTARGHVDDALRAALQQRGAGLTVYHAPQDPELAARQRQSILLHQAVGTSILLHRHLNVPLPHKGKAFDWGLGPGVRSLDRDARYALFVFIRDSYASSGRKAMMAVGLLLGIGVSLGQQIGFASLVDLDDGRVVWFNLLNAQTGDLRDAEGATASVAKLLDGVPL
ncbi:MAG: hypothetical protein DYH17_09690 [Xanthomonadales bacterium PRO6]|nr:hypothetical protein [Xanthomonadales bacterium PRO6]